jgi:hypothetical protein
VFGNEQAGPPERRSRHELHLPYTIVLRLDWGGQRGMVYFFAFTTSHVRVRRWRPTQA